MNLEQTFILIYFSFGLGGLVTRLIIILGAKYPRQEHFSVQIDFLHFLWYLGFVAWAAYILWGRT